MARFIGHIFIGAGLVCVFYAGRLYERPANLDDVWWKIALLCFVAYPVLAAIGELIRDGRS